MAKTTGIHYRGKIDNLIFYELAGKPYVRKAPSRVRQSRATKASAKLFGMAASMSAALRKGLAITLHELKDRKHRYTLNTALFNWLKEKESGRRSASIVSLPAFSFNESHALYSRLHKAVSVERTKSGSLLIRIPALSPAEDIDAPARTEAISWKLAAASCTVQNPSVARQEAGIDFEMPYEDDLLASREIEFPIQVKSGELAVVAISLQYHVENKGRVSTMTDPRWMPLDIVGCVF